MVLGRAPVHQSPEHQWVITLKLVTGVLVFWCSLFVSSTYAESGDDHYESGVVYRSNGQIAEAEAEFRKAIESFAEVGRDLFAGVKKKLDVRPNLANAYNDLGEILLEEGKNGEALEELKKAGEEYRKIIEKLQKIAK